MKQQCNSSLGIKKVYAGGRNEMGMVSPKKQFRDDKSSVRNDAKLLLPALKDGVLRHIGY